MLFNELDELDGPVMLALERVFPDVVNRVLSGELHVLESIHNREHTTPQPPVERTKPGKSHLPCCKCHKRCAGAGWLHLRLRCSCSIFSDWDAHFGCVKCCFVLR